MEEKIIKNYNWGSIITRIILNVLILCVLYYIFKNFITLIGTNGFGSRRIIDDYVVALIIGTLGIVTMILPPVITKKKITNLFIYILILFIMFSYIAGYLGEIKKYYYLSFHWDIGVHFFGAAMITVLGFLLVKVINKTEQVNFLLNPIFIALFAFCFALTVGAFWEIFEYTFEGFLKLNMQKFALANGRLLVGHAALTDTMKDIMVNTISAFITAAIGYFIIKNYKKTLSIHE